MDYSQTQLNEIIRRDWAVRVLDAWAARIGSIDQRVTTMGSPRLALRAYSWRGKHSTAKGHPGQDFAAARLAAAEAVWPELPESVRAEIGERP